MTVSVQPFPECAECGAPIPYRSREIYCQRCAELRPADACLDEPQEVEEDGQSDDWRTEDE